MQRAEVSGANPYKVRAFATAIKAIHELDYPITKSTHVKDVGMLNIASKIPITYFISFIRYLELGKAFHAEFWSSLVLIAR